MTSTICSDQFSCCLEKHHYVCTEPVPSIHRSNAELLGLSWGKMFLGCYRQTPNNITSDLFYWSESSLLLFRLSPIK